jgi:hypothetical protein
VRGRNRIHAVAGAKQVLGGNEIACQCLLDRLLRRMLVTGLCFENISEDHTETERVELRPFAFHKQIVEVVVEEEVSSAISHLKAQAITYVVEVKAIVVLLFLFTIVFIHELRVTFNAIPYVRAQAKPE